MQMLSLRLKDSKALLTVALSMTGGVETYKPCGSGPQFAFIAKEYPDKYCALCK
jgi:hypothetical protein